MEQENYDWDGLGDNVRYFESIKIKNRFEVRNYFKRDGGGSIHKSYLSIKRSWLFSYFVFKVL